MLAALVFAAAAVLGGGAAPLRPSICGAAGCAAVSTCVDASSTTADASTISFTRSTTASGDPAGDRVELKDGTKVAGRVVYEDDARIVVRAGSRDRELERKNVAVCESRLGFHREFLERWIDTVERDDGWLFDLLAFARRCELEDDARLLAWWILARSPENGEAHGALGHERRGETWHARDGGRLVPWPDLAKRRAAWGDAWQLTSRHYRVRTNLRLGDATDLVFGLECAHAAFYALLGRDLQLNDTTEPLVAHVHADRKSFPEMTGTNGAYYEYGSRILHVDASSGFDFGLVVHEACHQLLDATMRGTRGARPDVPGWLDEGLAEFLRAGWRGEISRWRFDPALGFGHHFRAQADAQKPFDLPRVLTFDASDFQASTRQDLKYAQAYTLVHWALRSNDGKRAPSFTRFLRGAYVGRGSSTDFKSAMGLDERALEKDWTEHVRKHAQLYR